MCPPLRELNRMMNEESSMLLPATTEAMEESFNKGLAVVLTSESGEAVGYLRFSVLLDDEKKRRLGIPASLPNVLEIGSAFIDPRFRGGVYSAVRNEALSMILPAIHAEQVLVIGTTKAVKVLHAASHAKELGIQFEPSVHTDYEMLSPLTCVCQGNFGSGMQFGDMCPRRITAEQLPLVESIASEQGGKIPCTMYVSNINLARRMDRNLREHFRVLGHHNPRQAWIEALGRDGHYE